MSKDERQTESWRKETCEMIRALNLRLLGAKLDDKDPPKDLPRRAAAR